jgi:predicted small metal-binding protein
MKGQEHAMANAQEPLWNVTCQCGWRTQGTRENVVAAVQEHGRTQHSVELIPEQVMIQATRVDPA